MMANEQLILYLVLISLGLVASMRPVPVVRVVIRLRPGAAPEASSLPVRIVRHARKQSVAAAGKIAEVASTAKAVLSARIGATTAATAVMARTCEEALLGGESAQPALAPCQ